MRKRLLMVLVCMGLFTVLISSLVVAQQNEQITISTYYPSPYGVYRELRAQRLTVGNDYINTSFVGWGSSQPPTYPMNDDVSLIVQGHVGIGSKDTNVPLNPDKFPLAVRSYFEDSYAFGIAILPTSATGPTGGIRFMKLSSETPPRPVTSVDGEIAGIGTKFLNSAAGWTTSGDGGGEAGDLVIRAAEIARVEGASDGTGGNIHLSTAAYPMWAYDTTAVGCEECNDGGLCPDTSVPGHVSTCPRTNLPSTKVFIRNDGKVGIGTTVPTAKLDVNSNSIRIRRAASVVKGTTCGTAYIGTIAWESDGIYVCDGSHWRYAKFDN